MRHLFCLSVILTLVPVTSDAATLSDQVEAAGQSGKYVYVMFYRDNDNATKHMANTIRSHVAETTEITAWVSVNVNDRNERQLLKRFDATRIPLPTVFGVAPNGAVTGVYRHKVNQQQLEKAILTPMYSEMVKALQSQQIAVVCLMPSPESSVPTGVTELEKDSAFKGQLHFVKASATDQAEADFFRRMKVDENLNAPVVLMFAPPGTYLGTFQATVTGRELAQTLHQSGKCNCEKCQKK